MSGWTILRICGFIAGTVALLRLATVGLGVEYKLTFQEFLDRLEDIVELGFIIDPIEKFIVQPFLDWLRSLGLTIPPLQEHWRSAFVLLWLVQGATVRLLGDDRGWGFPFIWAGVTALFASAMAGTVPLHSGAVFTWPIAGWMAFMMGILAREEQRGRYPLKFAAFAALFSFVSYFGSNKTVEMPSDFSHFSPGLLLLSVIVGLIGLSMLLSGLFAAARGRDPIDNPATSMGLDIVGVMGLALAIGSIMQA